MTNQEMVRAIQDSFETETGERPTIDRANWILEQMCDAFLHLWEGVGEEAARQQPEIATYLLNYWTGDERKRLKAALLMERYSA